MKTVNLTTAAAQLLAAGALLIPTTHRSASPRTSTGRGADNLWTTTATGYRLETNGTLTLPASLGRADIGLQCHRNKLRPHQRHRRDDALLPTTQSLNPKRS